MRTTTAAGASADSPDSETRRQAFEPGAAATAVSMGVGVAEALGALDPELAGRSEAGFGRGLTGRVAGGFDTEFAGRVAGVFGAGFYVVGTEGALFAVLSPGAWSGPLHLVTASLPGLPTAGERVIAAGTVLVVGELEIDFGSAQLWDPDLPDGQDYDPAVWAGAVPSVEPDLASVWGEVKAAVRAGDLASTCRLLEGRGGGLTPAGDDALAGIMLVAAAHRFQRPTLRRLAERARTSELSRAFLAWAARGSSIEPAHAVLEAVASGDRAGLARAARTLAAVGASSGRALLAGLTLAISELPPRPAGPRLAPAAGSPSAATPGPASPSPAGLRPGSVGSALASAKPDGSALVGRAGAPLAPSPRHLVSPPLSAGHSFV